MQQDRLALEVLLFFVAAATLVVYLIFDSPAFDYRFVAIGAILPLIEAPTARPWLLHTLLGAALMLSLVMLATRGARLRRRRWLGVPIGMLVFLAASGTWTHAALFWWPFGGPSAIGIGPLPEFNRPVFVLLALEMLGLTALLWLAHRCQLHHKAPRRRFFQTGRLASPQS